MTVRQMNWYRALSERVAAITAFATSAEHWANRKGGEATRQKMDGRRKQAENDLADWVIAHPYPNEDVSSSERKDGSMKKASALTRLTEKEALVLYDFVNDHTPHSASKPREIKLGDGRFCFTMEFEGLSPDEALRLLKDLQSGRPLRL